MIIYPLQKKYNQDEIDFKEKGFKYVTFSQFNEPLLDRRIFDILKFCKEKEIPVLFVTNGLLLNKEKNIENLIKFGTNIKISLQVLEADKHKDARGLNMELDRYVKTIVNFSTMSLIVCVLPSRLW